MVRVLPMAIAENEVSVPLGQAKLNLVDAPTSPPLFCFVCLFSVCY